MLQGALTAGIAAAAVHAQAPEPVLPRPGAVVVAQMTGEVAAGNGEQMKPVKADERVRIGSIITTGRKSLATLAFSNGVTVQLGSESELEIEEFGQETFSESVKVADLKKEPTISRTRLRLVRGDVSVEVKPLNVPRGSTFLLAIPAGTLRVREGMFRAMVRMSDLGLGVCTLELASGGADFELLGAPFSPVPTGVKLGFAVELDKATGVMKVGELPKPAPPAK